MKLHINGETREVDAPEDTPLLWVLRDHLDLTGTKFGCGVAQCGACTVHIDGRATRSCVTPAGAVRGRRVTTIEGVGDPLHPVQQAWMAHAVPQCGYCQSGQIMAAISFLRHVPDPTDEEIDAAMAGNICRCGTYPRIRAAIRAAAKALAGA
ncbi:MAG: (2Fe-2S)-binding protein [Alphaproteobacteria bacterium]|nr:(2Fe-2S)-binding protein [Alphaproteobacteria bacterium]